MTIAEDGGDEAIRLESEFLSDRPPSSSTIGNNDEINSHNDDNDTNSTTSSQRSRNFFSIFKCLVQPTRRMQQRVVFKNRWKKKGVKFDPNFHFIIGQLIIKVGKPGTRTGVTN
jgi:hypothetical protein